MGTKTYWGIGAALALSAVAAGNPAGAAIGSRGDIAIVPGSADAIVLEFRPIFRPLQLRTQGGTLFVEPAFAGSTPPLNIVPGEPYLPARSAAVELRSAVNTIEILEAEYSDSTGVLIAPAPEVTETGDGFTSSVYRISDEAYRRDRFYPETIAELVRVGETRGVLLGDLVITPAQYNPMKRTLRTYSRIVVRIVPAGALAPLGPRDEMTSGVAVNGSVRRGNAAGKKSGVSGGARLASSPLATGNWYRINVSAEGVYTLTGQQLLDAGAPASTDPHSVRLFSNNGEELPINPLTPAPNDLTEITRMVLDGATVGVLDGSDQILFYARGASGWRNSGGAISHFTNRYHATNYCWVTYGGASGKQMAVSASGLDDFSASSVDGMLFREDEKTNLLLSGMDWLGQSFGPGDRITYVHQLPGLDSAIPVRYRFLVGSRSSSASTFQFSEHNVALGVPVALASTVIGDYFRKQLVEAVVDRTVPVSWTDGQSQIALQYNTPSGGGVGFLDWYEIHYGRRLAAVSDRFDFYSADTAATVGYRVSGFSGGSIRAFDATRYDSVVSIPVSVSADTGSFSVGGGGGAAGRKRILAIGPSGYLPAGGLSPVPNQDLHGSAVEAEMVIIAHPAFAAAANRLKAHRESAGSEAVSCVVVNVDHVYNEFGGGIPSPVAVRNYLKYVYDNWSVPPKYVLLFGDGDFDYRKISTNLPTFIPPWETEESYWPLDTYSSDDFFAIYDASPRVKAGVGRLTARSAAEAETMVDKIVGYETASDRSPWKTLVTFVGDDGLAGTDEDDGFTHIRHAENVAAVLTDLFDKHKIYLFDYPTETTASGRRKPGANEAIRNAINAGTVVLNYSGHGNPRLWAHEAVFVRESDIPLLTNEGRYFILAAATCNYCHFDQVNDQSGGEILLAKPASGAIAVISATRVVFAFQNLLFNETLFSFLFATDSTGAVVRERMGDAIYKTKQLRNAQNDQKFFLAGDPAMMPAFPRRFVGVDSVNRMPAAATVDIYSLGESSVAATVRGDTAPGGFSGNAKLTVYDADRFVTISYVHQVIGPMQYTYRVNGNVIFRGEATVSANRIGASFIVPKDISFGAENGKIALYASNSMTDAAGFTRSIRIAGTDSTAPNDAEGPSVSLFLDSRSFRPGDAASNAPLLIADLADSSGINTSGAGIGHRLEAWIDDQPASVDLTGYYNSKPDTYRQGEIRYQLGSFNPGSHRLRLRAWDTHNNSSTEETVFSVGGAPGLSLSNILNYPNPFSRSTWFTFDHNQTEPLDVEIKIYTVAGRQIGSLSGSALTDRNVRIAWDGRDADGDALANGVYLYKIVARTADGRHSSEALGKLSINR